MDTDAFDALVKAVGAASTRRRVLGALIGAGGVALLADLLQTEAAPACNGPGKTCEGNQQCCPGMFCAVTGPGNPRRCALAPTRTPTSTPTETPTPTP